MSSPNSSGRNRGQTFSVMEITEAARRLPISQEAGRCERLGDAAEAAALARTLGQVWQASPTAGLYAITADADFEAHFGKKAAKRRKIYNGMIPCQIYMYFDRPVKPVRK